MYTGTRLTEIIVAGPLPAERVLRIGTTLAEVLATAHDEGTAFGGLSAATVSIAPGDEVQLLDAAYAPISARREDDLLALGALLYTMATGVTPHAAATAQGDPHAPPPSPIGINPRLPSGLVSVLRRGVHPDVKHRFQSAAEIVAALREVSRAPGSLESLLPAEHVSSSAAVKPPPRPPADERGDEDGDDELPFADR